jgi:hypothetical protein
VTECAKHTSLFRSLINYGRKNVLAHAQGKRCIPFLTQFHKKKLYSKRQNFCGKILAANFGGKILAPNFGGSFCIFSRHNGTDTGKQHPSKNFYLNTICQKHEEKEEK